MSASQPRLLDLFCCEGGAGMGYHCAGFDVVGVDIERQPRYPFPMYVGDALAVLNRLSMGERVPFGERYYGLDDFDVIHASPPCQAHSTITPDKAKHVDLIPATREALKLTGKPYIIENVEGAKGALIDPLVVCGSSFGLKVRRHRLFESSMYLLGIPCAHDEQGEPVGVYGGLRSSDWTRPDGTSRGIKAKSTDEAREAMGMPWASWHGATQAIPPAYTEFIGGQIMDRMSA